MPEAIHHAMTFDPVRVEITSPGTQHGRPFYFVDYVEADGCRAGMWSGADLLEARQAADECADDGMGGTLTVLDLVADVPDEIVVGTVH